MYPSAFLKYGNSWIEFENLYLHPNIYQHFHYSRSKIDGIEVLLFDFAMGKCHYFSAPKIILK